MPVILYLTLAVLLLGLESAHAAVFSVADGDVAGLTSAVNAANTNGEDDTIELATNGAYILTTVDNDTSGSNGLPVIEPDSGHSLTVHGNGATIDCNPVDTPFRVLRIGPGGNVIMSGLTVRNGYAQGTGPAGAGGAIYNSHGRLTLTDCHFEFNEADSGAVIYNDGFGGSGGAPATLQMNDCTMSFNTADSNGGGVFNDGSEGGLATAIINNSVIKGNSSLIGGGFVNEGYLGSAVMTITGTVIEQNYSNDYGGGGYNDGYQGSATLSLSNSVLRDNVCDFAAGGIYNAGISGSATLFVNKSTFEHNSASSDLGGAVVNDGGGSSGMNGSATALVNNSTFLNNVGFVGGAIFNTANYGNAVVTVTNSTLSNNSGYFGGAIRNKGDFSGVATLTVASCTFAGNFLFLPDPKTYGDPHGGGIHNDIAHNGSSTLSITNTVFKAGTSGENIYNSTGTVTSHGYNLGSDDGGGFLTATGDQINTDPMLDPAGLQNNGGPTKTIKLLAGSTAIDAGDPNAPARDQRYYLRNGAPDKGAFEYNGSLAPVSAASRKTHGAAGSFDVDLPLSGAAGIECRTGGAGGNHQVILNFATPVTAGTASVTTGTGSVSNATVSGSQVTLDLTGITNAQQIELTLSDASDGVNTNDSIVPMRVLLGDTNGNGTVNASDVVQTKAQLGQVITNSNFRNDINANGTTNASDVTIAKSQIGTSIPAEFVGSTESPPTKLER